MPEPSPVLFERLLIVGVGLLGASLGLAAKKNRLVNEGGGWGRNEKTLEIARRRGAIDFGTTVPDHADGLPSGSILVVVCTPVKSIPDFVDRLTKLFGEKSDLLLSDVGSTKENICHSISDSRFIGSHPVAGSEKSGPEFADADLFSGKTTILTPTAKNRETDVEKLQRFWERLGSVVVRMDARKHDSILAATSHLPHAVSATLASVLTAGEMPFTGTGYAGMTRLAVGSPEVWTDILSENRIPLLSVLGRFENKLRELISALESGEPERISQFLQNAAKQARERMDDRADDSDLFSRE